MTTEGRCERRPTETLRVDRRAAEIHGLLQDLHREGVVFATLRWQPGDPAPPDGDVDVLVAPGSEGTIRRVGARHYFVRTPNRGGRSGFFLRRVGADGVATVHVQQEVVFQRGDRLHWVPGLSGILLGSRIERDGVPRLPESEVERTREGKRALANGSPTDDPEGRARWDAFLALHGLRVQSESSRLTRWAARIAHRLGLAWDRTFRGQGVAVFGLDGVGKSTVTREVAARLGKWGRRQYMGQREWETDLARRALAGGPGRPRGRVPGLRLVVLWIEMMVRALRSRTRPGVVVFDRYPSEIPLSSRGLRRTVYTLLFRTLFPSPRCSVYLRCDPAVAFRRKPEIRTAEERDEWLRRRAIFDAYFDASRARLRLDTSGRSPADVADEILTSLGPMLGREL